MFLWKLRQIIINPDPVAAKKITNKVNSFKEKALVKKLLFSVISPKIPITQMNVTIDAVCLLGFTYKLFFVGIIAEATSF